MKVVYLELKEFKELNFTMKNNKKFGNKKEDKEK